jgi:DedD protein
MEKEQKKLLLVAVSVGVFLLVTITAAIVMMTPKVNNIEGASFTSSRPYPAGGADLTGIVPPMPSQPRETAQISREPEVPVEEPQQTTSADRIEGDRLTIGIPRPTTAAVPDNGNIPPASRPIATVAPAAPRTAPAVQTAPSAQAAPSAQSVPATATRPTATTTAARPATPAARPASPSPTARTTTPARTTTNDYWVQTGAFTAQVRAEDAKELLATKGITSIIENRQIDGKTWYRVRLGPYTSEKEANYWLALVKTIDGFGDSQVRQSSRQQ